MYIRNCPNCDKKIEYKSYSGFYTANKKNGLCKSCAVKKWQKEKNYSMLGEKNPFFGKKHSKKTKINMSKKQKESHNKLDSICKSQDFRQCMSVILSGKNNPMYDKTVYEIWLKKYGVHEADIRLKKLKNKHSKNNSGRGNPMYGKPAPKGSGYGWKGWYNDWFFRSLRELSYMINVIEKNGYTWKSAESEELSIPYVDWRGIERTYRADFLINNDTLIEIKPKKLHKSPSVLLKIKGAKKFCKQKKLKYRLIDCQILSNQKIKELFETNKIQFTEKYKKKYKDEYK